MQLDLFDYKPQTPGPLLLKGTNFLLLPQKKPFFESREILAASFLVAALFINLNKPDKINQQAIAGAFDASTVSAEIETPAVLPIIQTPAPTPAPLPHKSVAKPLRVERINVLILMYHHVGEPPTSNALDRSLTVSASDFEEQVAFFKQRGYQSVALAQVYAALSAGSDLPDKPIVFTFDDGYKDVFVNAVPILQKYGFAGTFAVAPALLEGKGYATWGEVYSAYRQGMEIVSHSMNHVDFASSGYSDEFLMIELEGSKLFLESRINAPVNFFVYPYGRYNARAIELVKKAGYKMAFTTELGTEMNLNKAFRLPRVRVHGQDGLAKLRKVLGL
ncbi:MAG: polysaccharide deacetylase family protein [Candidatus Doudnabacteria bacterium]|nr:polysaccharide deacetylase family protein [Candidatus Doudnabacteria bacterium]